MKLIFTREITEIISIEDELLREIIPDVDDLEFEEIEEYLNKYFYNKDLDNYDLIEYNEETSIIETKEKTS